MLLLEFKINKLYLGPLNFRESRYTCIFSYLASYPSPKSSALVFHFINPFLKKLKEKKTNCFGSPVNFRLLLSHYVHHAPRVKSLPEAANLHSSAWTFFFLVQFL